MKISALINHFSPSKGDFIKQYLIALGVKESDIDLYLHPNDSCFDNPYGYKNITLGAEMLKETLDGKGKMGILVDCDCDGDLADLAEVSPLFDGAFFPCWLQNAPRCLR